MSNRNKNEVYGWISDVQAVRRGDALITTMPNCNIHYAVIRSQIEADKAMELARAEPSIWSIAVKSTITTRYS